MARKTKKKDAAESSGKTFGPAAPAVEPGDQEPPCVVAARAVLDEAQAAVQGLEAQLEAAKRARRKAMIAFCDATWSEEAAAWRAERKIWRTGEGEEVFYRDMSDTHLENAIGLLKLKSSGGPQSPALAGLLEEKSRRSAREAAEA